MHRLRDPAARGALLLGLLLAAQRVAAAPPGPSQVRGCSTGKALQLTEAVGNTVHLKAARCSTAVSTRRSMQSRLVAAAAAAAEQRC